MDSAAKHKLGQWMATAICGNDITSSCLYVSAIVAGYAGAYAPIALGLVAIMLYLFRSVYAEVGTALPLNGGAYNVLLNTTSKKAASIAACLTVLSYVATAVISAGEAMHYASHLIGPLHHLAESDPSAHASYIMTLTIALLGIFAFLNIIGISESAIVALCIFIFHMLTLTVLAVVAMWAVLQDGFATFFANWALPPPDGRSIASAMFYGFSAALLGISGFESSANFIEEQREGVFAKTLRNMWIAVSVFNPLISLLSLGVLPLAQIPAHQDDLLAHMGGVIQGDFLRYWISLDALLVLSGAVLTSYVGVTGLVRRMALDRVMPQFLLRENGWRNTNHYIIAGFFLLCVSINWVTGGDIAKLAGVYTISFLGVMTLFALGNLLLKKYRGRLPRDVRANVFAVLIAMAGVVIGLIGNVALNPAYVKIFAIYAGIAIAVVALMFYRIHMLKGVLYIARRLAGKIDQITSLRVVYFTRGDNKANLNLAAQYVLANEQTRRLMVVLVYQDEADIPSHLAENLKQLDEFYPQLRIDFVAVKGKFGPELIEALSTRLRVPKNYMFIGTPGDHFPHRISELGGVRLVM